MFNRQTINTVGSGAGTNSGGTCPVRSAGKKFVVPLHFLVPSSGGTHRNIQDGTPSRVYA